MDLDKGIATLGRTKNGDRRTLVLLPDVIEALKPFKSSDLTRSSPSMVTLVDGHAAWVNTAAPAIAGIGPDTPDPEGGQILKDAYGRPTGILLDGALDLVAKHIPPATDAELEGQLRAGLLSLRADGFTAALRVSRGGGTRGGTRHGGILRGSGSSIP